MRNFLIICAIAIGFTACEKPAGEGGTSVIEGQVYKMSTEVPPSPGPFSHAVNPTAIAQIINKSFIFIVLWF